MSLFVKIKKQVGDFSLDVQFETDKGVLGLLGASGCGKSMTLKCIAGIMKPDEGQIILNGVTLFDSEKKINLPPQKRKVGYLFQEYALFPNMTVFQNVMCGAKDKAVAREYLKKFQLEGKAELFPEQLSGGQKQRVAMARLLAAGPDVLLLDEPFSALDNFLKAQVERELMKVLDTYENPVLFVSHDRNESFRMTDTIAVMDDGKIVDLSEKHSLFRAPKTLAATLLTGCKNVSKLRQNPDGSYFASDWGVELGNKEKTAGDTGDITYCYAGFRAHDLEPVKPEEEGGILLECVIEREVEDTFSVIVQFYQKGHENQTEYSLMTFETEKEKWKQIKAAYGEKNVVLRIPEDAIIWMER